MSLESPWEDFKPIPEVNEDEPWTSFTPMPKEEKVAKQKVRANLQGWTLGFADELEALVRSSVSSKSYEEIRDEIRDKLNAYREAHPKEALSMELLGAIVPTVAAYLTPWVGDEIAASANIAGAIKRTAKIGAAEGAVAGYATGEEGVVEDLTRVIPGAAAGAVFSSVLTLAGKPAGYIANSLMTKARQMFGDAGAGDVAAKIRQLAESTGRSEDDIILAISRGEIMADDPGIRDALTALNNDIKVTTPVDEVLINRADKASKDAADELQKGLTPGVTGNVFADYRKKEKATKKAIEGMYTDAYKNTDRLSNEIVDSMKSAIESESTLTAALDEIYKLKKMKPLVRIPKTGKNKGKVIFNREPTLEDAEIIRRAIAEAKDDAFNDKAFIKGGLLDGFEKELRGHLDNFSDDLRLAREERAILFSKNEAFDVGRKAFSKDSDELAVIIQDMMSGEIERGKTSAIEGLRAGLMVAIRDKIKKQPTFFNKVSKEGEQFNEVLRQVFPDENIDDVIEKVRLASVTKNTKDKVLGGSQTAGREQAKLDMGSVASAATGNPSAIANLAFKVVGNADKQLTTEQRNKVVSLILEEDPELIRKVLLDNSYMKQIQGYINRVATGMLDTVALTGNIEAANLVGDEAQKMLNTLRR
jgi:hypothetical protein